VNARGIFISHNLVSEISLMELMRLKKQKAWQLNAAEDTLHVGLTAGEADRSGDDGESCHRMLIEFWPISHLRYILKPQTCYMLE